MRGILFVITLQQKNKSFVSQRTEIIFVRLITSEMERMSLSWFYTLPLFYWLLHCRY